MSAQVRQLFFDGDSLMENTEPVIGAGGISFGQGGNGGWCELCIEALARIPGIGPLISSGWMHTYRQDGLWTKSGTFGTILSTSANDRSPYGGGDISTGGATSIRTFTVPVKWRKNVGFGVLATDCSGGGQFRWRVDGGVWSQHGQTLNGNGKLFEFYINAPATSTIEFQGFDGTSAVSMIINAVQLFFLPPTTKQGLIGHNIARNGTPLNDHVAVTTGDRMGIYDDVKIDTPNAGGMIHTFPDALVSMHINDVRILNSVTQWDTDMRALNTRVGGRWPLFFMYSWELAQFPDEPNSVSPGYPWADQAAYRTQTATTAAAIGTPWLNLFDLYQKDGYGGQGAQNIALRAQGYVNPLDNGHPLQAGMFDIYPKVYWWLRKVWLSSIISAPNYFIKGSLATSFAKGAVSATPVKTYLPIEAQ